MTVVTVVKSIAYTFELISDAKIFFLIKKNDLNLIVSF